MLKVETNRHAIGFVKLRVYTPYAIVQFMPKGAGWRFFPGIIHKDSGDAYYFAETKLDSHEVLSILEAASCALASSVLSYAECEVSTVRKALHYIESNLVEAMG